MTRIKQTNRHITKRANGGFILPSVLLIGLGTLTIGLLLLQTSSSIRASIDNRYYAKLASQAAEAGADYASYCLSLSGYLQTWGPAAGKPDLTQSTNCSGQALTNPVNSITNASGSPTSFDVGDLSRGTDGTYIIQANGSVRRSSSVSSGQPYHAYFDAAVGNNLLRASLSAAGHSKTCGVTSGAAYCWGDNSGSVAGQLGDGTINTSYTPVKVLQEPGLLAGKNVTAIATGYYQVCVVASGGAYCWGQNYSGQLGNNSTNPSPKPVAVQGALSGKTVTAIATPGNTTCAIANGKIYCWGDNANGTAGTGDSTTSQYLTPTLVTSGLPANYTATSLASSAAETQTMCAIVSGQVYCWGDNRTGAIGIGTDGPTGVFSPTAVSTAGALNGKTIVSVSVEGHNRTVSPSGGPHVCAISSDSQLYCWGDNSYGQLGLGDTSQRDSPTYISAFAGQTVRGVANEINDTCVFVNAWVDCMGSNQFGQLGNNSPMTASAESTTPTPIVDGNGVLTAKTITNIGGGGNRSCIIANYLTYCWGFNSVGQIGDGTTVNRNVPTLAKFLQPATGSYLF